MRPNFLARAALLGSLFAAAACDADLQETCVGGDGTCDPQTGSSSSSSATTGGGGPGGNGMGGGGGSTPMCFDGCNITAPSNQTGEFPCAVEAIMTNCRRCHTDQMTPEQPAPFLLDTYAQSQSCEGTGCAAGLYAGQTVWFRMRNAIETDFMPLTAPKLMPVGGMVPYPLGSEKKALLDDWACLCAPPRPDGEICD